MEESYDSVGHDFSRAAVLWALIDGEIQTTVIPAGRDYKAEPLHDDIWRDAEEEGRIAFAGRYEPDTGIVSVSPRGKRIKYFGDPAEWLKTKLEEKFGGDLDVRWFGRVRNPGTMSQNPPWSSKIYAQVCDEIHEKVEALGLPMPMEDTPTSRGGCVLDPELGEGHYGVVYRTIRNDTVFKITTDETEAHFVSLLPELRARRVDPSGIVKYYAIFAVESTHRGRPVFVLWREAAEHVGKVSSVFCKSGDLEHLPWQKEWKADDPYLCNQYKVFERLLHAWQKFCGLAREIYLGTKKKAYAAEASENFWIWIDEQMQSIENEQVWDLGDDIWEKYQEERRSGYDDLGKVRVRLARHPNKFAILVHIASRIAEEMANENVAYQVGRAFSEYLEAGILMADVHLGNLGFVAPRPDDNDFAPSMPVITDPGHVLVLRRELSESHIERL